MKNIAPESATSQAIESQSKKVARSMNIPLSIEGTFRPQQAASH
jgi:hypothetical protein